MKNADQWKEMIAAFDAYVHRTGNGEVPTNYPRNPRLGRWVAMIRYRRKLGELEPAFVAELDRKGFCWSPGEQHWASMLQELIAFRTKYDHSDVPTDLVDGSGLASWVANQRHLRKRGALSKDRIRRLDEIGFCWNVYGHKGEHSPEKKCAEKPPARQVVTVSPLQTEERLYHVGADGYVQYAGAGELPDKLQRYLAHHRDWPPYIPLPTVPTRFMLTIDGSVKVRRIVWKGRGPLPADIITYVNENGCLPPLA